MADGSAQKSATVGRLTAAILITLILAGLPIFVPALGHVISKLHIGDPMALAGIIIAMGGFAITIWQLYRTTTAAKASVLAVNGLKFRLRALEDVQICQQCLATSGEIERQHVLSMARPSLQTLVFLPERYRTLRLDVTELRARRRGNISPEDQQVLQNAIAKLSDGENAVMRYLANERARAPNLVPLQSAIQALSNILTGLSVSLNETASGESNEE